MKRYDKAYLNDVVYNQGKLFDYVSWNFTNCDILDFIQCYMKSNTRKYLDQGKAYLLTMDYKELLDYFLKNDNYKFKEGKTNDGFIIEWIGEFYAYYQWYYSIESVEAINKVSLDYLIHAYPGLHDLDLELAVIRVGN